MVNVVERREWAGKRDDGGPDDDDATENGASATADLNTVYMEETRVALSEQGHRNQGRGPISQAE